MTISLSWLRRPVLALVVSIVLAGCATTGADRHPQDPLEPLNRAVYGFNEDLDKMVLQPVAITYTSITPRPVQRGVRNFFSNLDDAWSAINSALQLKGQEAMNSFWRFTINSAFGLGGLLDIATEAQIPKTKQDLGSTLNYWGVGTGPYLVLPVLGPSTLRDALISPVNGTTAAISHVPRVSVRNSLLGAHIVNTRAGLLSTTDLLQQTALDPYSFVRDAWLQQRQQNRRQQDADDANDPSSADHSTGRDDTATAASDNSTTDTATDTAGHAAPTASPAEYESTRIRGRDDTTPGHAAHHPTENPANSTGSAASDDADADADAATSPSGGTAQNAASRGVHSPDVAMHPAITGHAGAVGDAAAAKGMTGVIQAKPQHHSRRMHAGTVPYPAALAAMYAYTGETLRISTLELARTTSPRARVRLGAVHQLHHSKS